MRIPVILLSLMAFVALTNAQACATDQVSSCVGSTAACKTDRLCQCGVAMVQSDCFTSFCPQSPLPSNIASAVANYCGITNSAVPLATAPLTYIIQTTGSAAGAPAGTAAATGGTQATAAATLAGGSSATAAAGTATSKAGADGGKIVGIGGALAGVLLGLLALL